MKKIISILLIFTLLAVPTAFADETASNNLQSVLVKVKTKISVPEELSKFESNVSSYGGNVFYNFDWHTPDYEKSLSVTADGEGNITNYGNYTEKVSEKKLSGISKSEIIAYADSFIEKALPEMYSELKHEPGSYRANGSSRYSFTYQRYMFDVPVKDNFVSITVCISENDTLYIRNMSASIDYETLFVGSTESIDNHVEKYMEAFPLELVYRSNWNSGAKEANHELIYRLKDNFAGFISAETGEIVVEDSDNEVFKEESSNDSASGGGSSNKGDVLTEQELAEISAVEGLLSISQIEKKVKAIPYIKFPSGVSVHSSSLSKNLSGEYIYNIHYENSEKDKYSYVSLAVNAKDGKLISFNCSSAYDDVTLTEKQKKNANSAIEKFLGYVAEEEFRSTELSSENENGNLVSKYYNRTANGIKHINNGINVAFDTSSSVITSFYLNFTDGTFEDPEKAVSANAAYKGLREYSPLVIMYVKSGGEYKECYTLKNGAAIVDAMTGDVKNISEQTPAEFSYTDIEGHWAEEAATKLAEIQVGLPGGKLNPKEYITQEEYLTLLASGIYGYNYSGKLIYDMLIREGIITEEEKNPEAAVSREEAFVYLIRMAGFEKIAKLKNIYKVDYADVDKISEGKIGYLAILSGLGVINGDGGKIRPTDSLTRAEAIVILYRYLLTI